MKIQFILHGLPTERQARKCGYPMLAGPKMLEHPSGRSKYTIYFAEEPVTNPERKFWYNYILKKL